MIPAAIVESYAVPLASEDAYRHQQAIPDIEATPIPLFAAAATGTCDLCPMAIDVPCVRESCCRSRSSREATRRLPDLAPSTTSRPLAPIPQNRNEHATLPLHPGLSHGSFWIRCVSATGARQISSMGASALSYAIQ